TSAMRSTHLSILAFLLAMLTAPAAFGQPPEAQGKGGKDHKGVPDELRVMVKDVEEAYKAPFEVDKDVLDELRKAVRQPTPEREARIFRDIRRLYEVTAEQEQAILREIRRTYEQPSAEQEERVLREIRRAKQLPPGTVPESVRTEQA